MPDNTIRTPLYDMQEIPVKAGAAAPANPFDLTIQAHFRHVETGRLHRVDDFYDGKAGHRVRFMPTLAGRWRYIVLVQDRLTDEGELVCGSARETVPGPLQADPASPYHFRFADGSDFFMMGNTAYNAVVAQQKNPKGFRAFLDYYAERGISWLRFLLMQTTWPTTGGVVWPFGGTPESPDFTTFNTAVFEAAEAVIAELAARRSVASVILFHPHDEAFQACGEEKMTVSRRLIKYANARLGAYWNVVWNMANEWQRGLFFRYDEMDALGACLDEIDPYGRMIACHDFGRFEFYQSPWTDMSSIQERGDPHHQNRNILQNRFFGKPVINEECGYEQDNLSPPNDPEDVRRDHWAIAMAGGYSSFGDKTKGPKVSVYFSGLLEDAVDPVNPDQIRHLVDFMKSLPYKKMQPANALLMEGDPRELFVLARPGEEYAVYCSHGGRFSLCLTHARGTLAVRWLNPRTGEYRDARDIPVEWDYTRVPELQQPGANRRHFRSYDAVAFEAPDARNDWVLHLKLKSALSA